MNAEHNTFFLGHTCKKHKIKKAEENIPGISGRGISIVSTVKLYRPLNMFHSNSPS